MALDEFRAKSPFSQSKPTARKGGLSGSSDGTSMPCVVASRAVTSPFADGQALMQMRSVIESVTCGPHHTVKIVLKSGTMYELADREWTRIEQGPKAPSGKPAIARFFAGRAECRLGQEEDPGPAREDERSAA